MKTQDQIRHIADKFQIGEDQAQEILRVLIAGTANFSDEDYELMFSYYCDSGEIPYDIATSGDPYVWISQHLKTELEILV